MSSHPKKVAEFRNMSNFPEVEVMIVLSVAATAQSGQFAAGGLVFPQPQKVRSSLFIFDTGAQWSVISEALSTSLGFRRTAKDVTTARGLGGEIDVVECRLMINLGTWIEVPCLIQCSQRPNGPQENLLGMKGLLDRYRFSLDGNAVRVYAKPERERKKVSMNVRRTMTRVSNAIHYTVDD